MKLNPELEICSLEWLNLKDATDDFSYLHGQKPALVLVALPSSLTAPILGNNFTFEDDNK